METGLHEKKGMLVTESSTVLDDFFRTFLDAMHYGSPSGGGGWHSLYNLIRDKNIPNGF